MKTLIVALYPYNGQGLDSWHDHGAGMTYTSAKLAGHDVSFLDLKTLTSDNDIQGALSGYDLVSFGMKSSYYSIGMKVLKAAKANGSKTLVAGYHATAAPQQLVENPDIDYIFYGESEITFPEFLANPSTSGREIFGEKPKNLDLLPFMDRSIYRNQLEPVSGWWRSKTANRSNMISVIAARGCPYKCAFCQPIEEKHFGRTLRRRSVDSLISELKQLKSTYNPECVMIHDDTFLLQPKWLEEFIEKYPEINLPFWAAGRADGICKHPDLVKRLINVGWELVSVGFESGSQRILNLLKKGTTVEQNIEAAEIVHSLGASLYANYITGIPWETKWDIQATHKMADKIKAEMPSWAYFTPYPGCELGEELIQRGWSLLDRKTYDRCPSGRKSKYVNYEYVEKAHKGLREEVYPTFTDIIIPAYNNEDYSINCVNSIKESTTPATYRIIFVDNCSVPSSVEKVKEALQGTDHLLIQMSTNEGFVGAVNTGLAKSDAPNVCLLNNDTVVSKGWLEKLISALANNKELGIVGALTGYGKGSAVDSHHSLSLHSSLLPKESTSWDLDQLNKGLEERYKGRTQPIAFVAFLCAVIKRELIDRIGPLDPNYAMGMWDDLDYNRSAWKLGYKTELALDICIKHFGRSTFNLIQMREKFDVDSLLASNKAYLDQKWSEHPQQNHSDKPIVISRAIYTKMGDVSGLGILTESRLSIMQRYFINCLKNQTDRDFSICLVVGAEDNETTKRIRMLDWGDLDISFIYTQEDLSTWAKTSKRSGNYGFENDKGCPEYITKNSGHPISSIMARLDTDDWVVPGWIAHMKHLALTTPDTHFLINYQIFGQDIDGRLYNFNYKHTRKYTSPFISLIQKTEPRISPYNDFHLKMGNKFSKVITISPSYAFMVIHEGNRSNRFYNQDTYIEDGPAPIDAEVSEKPLPPKKLVVGTNWKSRIAAGHR